MENPERKNVRISDFDYAAANYYFVTLCADKRRNIFSTVRRDVILSALGRMADDTFSELEQKFDVKVDRRTIMPDHIHFILIVPAQRATARGAPTLGRMIGAYKSIVAKKWRDYCRESGTAHFPIWQRNYYEHVIRNDRDLYETRQYIENNPLKLLQGSEK